MTFKYRSPNDKSVNAGGLGSVASFNETQNNYPPYGTILSQSDTSRTEFDSINVGYWMPYTTYTKADGGGGTFNEEVWGLQYLPAGWVSTVYNANDTTLSYDFTLSDSTHVQGSVTTTYETFHVVNDGTGIQTAISQGFTTPYPPTSWVDNFFDGATYRWIVLVNANGDGIDLTDYTMYAPNGTNIGSGTDNASIWVTEVGNYFTCGTVYWTSYSDGYGGSWTDNLYYWAAPGTEIAIGNSSNAQSFDSNWTNQYYDNGITWYDAAIMNGSGQYGDGTYTWTTGLSAGSYYPLGTQINTIGNNPNYIYWGTMSQYQFEDGTGTYDVLEWDGWGGFMITTYNDSSYEPAWTYIGNFDEGYGIYFDLWHDGMGGLIAIQT